MKDYKQPLLCKAQVLSVSWREYFVLKLIRLNCNQDRLSSKKRVLATAIDQQSRHHIPRSHKFQTQVSVSPPEATQIMAFNENYQQPAQIQRLRTVTADSQVVRCSRISYQQVIRILHPLQASPYNGPTWLMLTQNEQYIILTVRQFLIPIQYHLVDKCINESVQSQPATPLVRGILDQSSQHRSTELTCFQPRAVGPQKPISMNTKCTRPLVFSPFFMQQSTRVRSPYIVQTCMRREQRCPQNRDRIFPFPGGLALLRPTRDMSN